MDVKIQKLQERLTKHRAKIIEMQAQVVDMEKEIKRAEEEHLGCLARSAAVSLSGGMGAVFEVLRGLQAKAENESPNIESPKKTDEKKEDKTVE